MSKSKHSAAILKFVAENEHCTTSDIAEALGLSASRARELLALELKAGTLQRDHHEVDGCKVLVYWPTPLASGSPAQPETAETLTAPKASKKPAGKAAPKAKQPKAPKERKPRRKASGIGKPNAKKVVNPQQTLDLKKALVERNGGKMVWANRVWVITVGKDQTVFKSRDLAALTLEDLANQLGIKA